MENTGVFFKKTGKELKSSLLNKMKELEIRLKLRKEKFEKFTNDSQKVASFFMKDSDFDDEERDELWQIGHRINEIEEELKNINIKLENLKENEIYKFDYHRLIENGFNLID